MSLLAAVCIGVCLLVWLKRGQAVWQVSHIEPGVAVTSGCEEASFNALWQYTSGHAVYTNSKQIPFSASYFNWLFYVSYGTLLRPLVAAFGGGAIVLWGRALSLCGAFAGALALWALAARRGGGFPRVGAALALFTFSGPLVGWWALTVRPDVVALALESLGVALLLLSYQGRRPTGVIVAAVLFYCAWSFKQNCVAAGLASFAFLLVRGEGRRSLYFALTGSLLVLVSLWLLGPGYRESMRDMVQNSDFSLALGFANLSDALRKMAPLVLAAIPALYRLFRLRKAAFASPGGDLLLLGAIGVSLSLPIYFVASCKAGAWSNYFFNLSLMVALVALSAGIGSRWERYVALGALALATVEQGACLAGVVGTIDLRPQAEELHGRWEAWKSTPPPRFSHDLRLNLPWLNPGFPAFVLAYNYPGDRGKGLAFERDGVGGLIRAGYFRSLFLPREGARAYDGAGLESYRARLDVGSWSVYELRR